MMLLAMLETYAEKRGGNALCGAGKAVLGRFWGVLLVASGRNPSSQLSSGWI